MTARKAPKIDKELKPININREIWMYAERRGLLMVHEFWDAGYIRTDQFYIPWPKVKRAVQIRERIQAEEKRHGK